MTNRYWLGVTSPFADTCAAVEAECSKATLLSHVATTEDGCGTPLLLRKQARCRGEILPLLQPLHRNLALALADLVRPNARH